jgi:hypothetical protein
MAVEGSIDLFGLPHILQTISQQGKTGILTIQGQQDIVAVSFLGGRIVAADSLAHSVEEGLSKVLVGEGLLGAAEFARANVESQVLGSRLLDLLVERRYLTRQQLLAALRLHTVRQLEALLRWQEGDFKFYGGDEVSYEEGFDPISVEDLLLRTLADFAAPSPGKAAASPAGAGRRAGGAGGATDLPGMATPAAVRAPGAGGVPGPWASGSAAHASRQAAQTRPESGELWLPQVPELPEVSMPRAPQAKASRAAGGAGNPEGGAANLPGRAGPVARDPLALLDGGSPQAGRPAAGAPTVAKVAAGLGAAAAAGQAAAAGSTSLGGAAALVGPAASDSVLAPPAAGPSQADAELPPWPAAALASPADPPAARPRAAARAVGLPVEGGPAGLVAGPGPAGATPAFPPPGWSPAVPLTPVPALPRQFRQMQIERVDRGVPLVPRLAAAVLAVGLAALLVVAVRVAPETLLLPFPWEQGERNAFLRNQRESLYDKIAGAAKTAFLRDGRFPDGLAQLRDSGLLSAADLDDPRGEPLRYTAREDSYTLQPTEAHKPLADAEASESIAGDFFLDPALLQSRVNVGPPIVLLD